MKSLEHEIEQLRRIGKFDGFVMPVAPGIELFGHCEICSRNVIIQYTGVRLVTIGHAYPCNSKQGLKPFISEEMSTHAVAACRPGQLLCSVNWYIGTFDNYEYGDGRIHFCDTQSSNCGHYVSTGCCNLGWSGELNLWVFRA